MSDTGSQQTNVIICFFSFLSVNMLWVTVSIMIAMIIIIIWFNRVIASNGNVDRNDGDKSSYEPSIIFSSYSSIVSHVFILSNPLHWGKCDLFC